jgi:adenine deaminase
MTRHAKKSKDRRTWGFPSYHQGKTRGKYVQKLLSIRGPVGHHDFLMALSFLALPVIPELKIRGLGLVDARAFNIVPLFKD